MNNPLDFIKAVKNPKQFVVNYLKQQNNNPMLSNLIQMAEKGDTQGVENFAKNYFNERGENFDDIMSNFK